ncbi:MAG: hypothetical protein ACEQSR_16335 [Candidatus Methylacidiphilales bacterium]
MNKYTIILSLMLLQSCVNKNKEITPQINSIELPTPFSILAQEAKLYKSRTDNAVYFLFGNYANTIYKYNLTLKTCEDSFVISSKVGMIEDFQLVNDTFIFHLYNTSIFALQPIKDSALCQVYRYPEMYNNKYISYGSVYYNGLLYARFPNDTIVGTKKGWAKHFDNPFINVFKFEADSVRNIASFGNYPNECKTGLLVSLMHKFPEPIKNKIYASHEYSESLEVYDLNTKAMSNFKLSSNYFKPIKLVPEDKIGDSYYVYRKINNNAFVDLIYNPVRKEFYRYFIHQLKENADDLASIIIYNEETKTTSEVVIKREDYTRACQIFPTEKGFALLRNLTTKKSKKQPLAVDEFILD